MEELTTWELYPVETNIQITYKSKYTTKRRRLESAYSIIESATAVRYMNLTINKPIANKKNSWYVSISTDIENEDIDEAVMTIHDSEANSRLKKSNRVPGNFFVNPYSIIPSSIKDSGDGKVSFEFKVEIM